MNESPNTVELIGHYGGDETHACSAWTSTNRPEYLDAIEENTGRPRRERIPSILNILARSTPAHTSPFEKSFLHFLVRTDKATHIHIIKHRIAVSVNAESARYKELKEDNFYYPTDWPTEEDAKASGVAQAIRDLYFGTMRITHDNYHRLVDLVTQWNMQKTDLNLNRFTVDEVRKECRKRAKDSSRFVLPHASQVMQDVAFNFLSFMHFTKLRNHPHAQLEVRQVAKQMLCCVKMLEGNPFKYSLEAFGY